MSDEDTTPEVLDLPAEETAAESAPEEQIIEDAPIETPQEPVEAPVAPVTEPSPQDVKPEKPASRRSAQYRINQLTQQVKELKEQQKPANEWEEPVEPNPEMTALKAEIEELRGLVKPVMDNTAKSADDLEISEVFTGDNAADRAKYEARIREMWNDPKAPYKDVSASDLYKIAKFDELKGSIESIKQQAIEEYKKAGQEAQESSGLGNSDSSNRTVTGEKSAWDMSEEEFLKVHNKARAG
jgi:hypothetical protein